LPPKKIASPTPPPIAPESSLATHKAVNKNNRETTKIKSSIMLTGGSSKSEQKGKGGTKIDSNTASGTFTPAVTTASAAVVTTIGDMATTITQGKILDSVLETPINTLYPGPIRAVISRDIYSEKGTNVLIPKGSRIIGSIKGGYKAGSTRVAVNWTRIILPSGYDINITSAPGTDKLGMLGVEGIVNRQFIETIGSAALLSIINISAAKMVEDYFNIKSNSQTTSTSSSGVVTTQNTQTPTQQAAQTEFTNLSNLTKDWLKQNFVPTPYIVVDQGTRIKVFVNQDIRFPKNLNGTNFIR
jgi:type IV secretion system protein VirB10